MNFQEQLNPKQWEAVSTSSQFVRIIAGAGSGKTRVLTFRLAYLIQSRGIFPESLLAITFTNKVAKEMLQRASQLVPEVGSRLKIMTYHSFAARFLRREIQHLGYPSSFTILDDEDQEKLVKNIAEEQGFKRGDEIVKQALHYIAEQKSSGIAPEAITITYERFPNEQQCLTFYRIYEEKLRAMSNLDFDDLLIKAIEILDRFPEIRRKWQGYYQHILVDEFQDTNDVQYRLLNLLLDTHTSLYVVGDPDQTIYSWRGANPKIILDLTEHFPVDTIILNQNYRSTKPILDVANILIDQNQHRVKKDLFTELTQGKAVEHHRYASREEEAHAVVRSIQTLLQSGTQAHDVAILYRANYLTLPFEKALSSYRIPFRIFGGIRFYQRQEIKDVVAYLKLMINTKDDLSFERIINVPRRGIGDVTFKQLVSRARMQQQSLYQASVELVNAVDAPVKLKTQLTPMMTTMEHYRIRLTTEGIDVRTEVEACLQTLGYLESLRQAQEDERLDNVYTLLDDLDTYFEQHEDATFIQYLENISLMSSQDEIVDDNFVSLMTVHTAKGLEFNHVYVIGLNEGVFPSMRTITENAYMGLEEERRLCYVAFTRAKTTLTVTCASDFSFVIGGNLTPSRFLKEAGLVSQFRTHGSSAPVSQGSFSASRLGVVHTPATPHQGSPKKKNTWQVGDHCHHETFGRGTIVQIISQDILEIAFSSPSQTKKIIAQHPKLNKVE